MITKLKVGLRVRVTKSICCDGYPIGTEGIIKEIDSLGSVLLEGENAEHFEDWCDDLWHCVDCVILI